ncbi:hypothetical protein PVAND_007646 [Polypedilum vanderplanki]|uniref:Protein rolling stone n=1 Tax=Polypedilum vanderplanki TaxID=319348 RepID=A0A9J6C6Z0_POLVA|nr:hypothetical protein PVAND_007646 [Polypedilum vanderplanki]
MHSLKRDQLILSFIYLTRWNLYITAVTCTLSAYFTTLNYCRKLSKQNQMTIWLKIFWFLHNNIILYSILISGIYWSLLHDGSAIDLNNVLIHMKNSLVLIFDLLIIQHPYRKSHFIYPIICGAIYELFTVIYTLSGGIDYDGNNYVYSIINWNKKPVSSIIVSTLLLISLAIMHMMICSLHAIRTKLGNYVNTRQNMLKTAKEENIMMSV